MTERISTEPAQPRIFNLSTFQQETTTELKELASAFAVKLGIEGLALENFRPAAGEAAAREDEVPALGLPASGFISV